MPWKRIKNLFSAGFLFRTAFMVFIWWILTEGDIRSLWASLPFALMASVFWGLLYNPVPVRLGALSLFFIYFVWQSLLAGIDVAFRVMRPGLSIRPAILQFPFRLPEGPSRVFLSDTLNLMPGTLTVKMSGDMIEVHVLDESGPVLDRSRILEKRVAAVFGHAIT